MQGQIDTVAVDSVFEWLWRAAGIAQPNSVRRR
jgi:hypothetical protein